MNLKSKFAIGMVAATLAVAVPFSASAAATSSELKTIGGVKARFVTDFEDVTADAYATGSVETTTHAVLDGAGEKGSKGMALSAKDTITDGAQDWANYAVNLDPNANLQGFDGADSVIFYVDFTKQGDENPNPAIQFVFETYDYDADGNIITEVKDGDTVKTKTVYGLMNSVEVNVTTLKDGETEWKPVATGTAGSYLTLSNDFKGYVRVPFEDLSLYWDSKDTNGKVDYNGLTMFHLIYGVYPRDIGADYAVSFDNLGFAGDGLKDTLTSSTDDGSTTSTTSTTSTASKTSTTAKTSSTAKSNSPKTGDTLANALVASIAVSGLAVLATGVVLKKKRG